MIAHVRTFLFSFQTKLVLALTSVILLTIFLAGTVFVLQTRDEREEQALDRVAAASPAIYQQAFTALVPDASRSADPFSETLDDLGREQDMRILILSTGNVVLYDTGESLTGFNLDVPDSSVDDFERGFISWNPDEEFPVQDITFVAASSRFVTETGREVPFRIVLAVETNTIADAWVSVLPGLLIAGAVAVPISALFGIFLARQVAQPVRKLTAASEAMAGGDFSQRVEVERDDEIGRLARSFTRMAERVGQRDSQMRALLANVSHDLKTPMTSITGYAQSLSDGTAGTEDIERIGHIIRDEADHVNRLLGDLLYLGEIDAGEYVKSEEDVPLAEVVGRCVRRIEPVAQSRRLELRVSVDDEAVLHDIDPEKVERALTNIFDNAAKFTPEGGTVDVRGRILAGYAPPRIECAITNSGSAIDDADLTRIFDRFFRGDRARRTASGNGLGLAITRELIELNRGTIEASNEPDGHVTFRVTLPGLPVAAPGRAPAKAPASASASA